MRSLIWSALLESIVCSTPMSMISSLLFKSSTDRRGSEKMRLGSHWGREFRSQQAAPTYSVTFPQTPQLLGHCLRMYRAFSSHSPLEAQTSHRSWRSWQEDSASTQPPSWEHVFALSSPTSTVFRFTNVSDEIPLMLLLWMAVVVHTSKQSQERLEKVIFPL